MSCIRRALVVALLIVPGHAALATAAPALHCGDTVTSSVVLHADLTGCPDYGLKVGADGVTVDLNGHRIQGDGIPFGDVPDVGVLSEGFDRVTIENGTVRGFDIGVLASDGQATRVLDLTVRQSGRDFPQILVIGASGARVAGNDTSGAGVSGITLLNTDHSTAARNLTLRNPEIGICICGGQSGSAVANRVADAGDTGIFVGFGAGHATVVSNAVSRSAFSGIGLEDSSNNLVAGNALRGNGDGITFDGSDNRVAGNVVTDSVGCEDGCGLGISDEGGLRNVVAHNWVSGAADRGIRLDAYAGETSDNVFRDNVVRGAGTDAFAIGVDAVGPIGPTLLRENRASGAADDGFDVRVPETTLTRNVALRNGDLGFEVVAGATDGGGNRALLNGNPLQCVGIACG
jgi:parallel beta-helix repeat protein